MGNTNLQEGVTKYHLSFIDIRLILRKVIRLLLSGRNPLSLYVELKTSWIDLVSIAIDPVPSNITPLKDTVQFLLVPFLSHGLTP